MRLFGTLKAKYRQQIKKNTCNTMVLSDCLVDVVGYSESHTQPKSASVYYSNKEFTTTIYDYFRRSSAVLLPKLRSDGKIWMLKLSTIK